VTRRSDLAVGRDASLTRYQWAALRSDFNLADGHSKQEQSPADVRMLGGLEEMYLYASEVQQDSVQAKFADTFFTVAGQLAQGEMAPPLYHYSASVSIAIVAQLLSQRNATVSLMHPTFDNIPDLLRRHRVEMRPFPASALRDTGELDKHRGSDALFLVAPNNPSGEVVREVDLVEIARFCTEEDLLLVIDFSFRFFSSLTEWDQYAVLRNAGTRFVCIEDTGKTWPSLDLKLGILVADSESYRELEVISDDYLLNVSPFIFTLLQGYIEGNPDQPWREQVAVNQKDLWTLLGSSGVYPVDMASTMSVSWLRLPPRWDGAHLAQWLTVNGVSVCPGAQFYWAMPERGQEFIRAALLRPRAYFKAAARRLAELVRQYDSDLPLQSIDLNSK
jgi:aspartate/methionine/tyrosine aminotransferase